MSLHVAGVKDSTAYDIYWRNKGHLIQDKDGNTMASKELVGEPWLPLATFKVSLNIEKSKFPDNEDELDDLLDVLFCVIDWKQLIKEEIDTHRDQAYSGELLKNIVMTFDDGTGEIDL